MPTLTIDDRTIEVEPGVNLIDAARSVGVQIPHYCYHPRLSVVGQCRMCLVQVEGAPKLQAACSTPVSRDMTVFTTTPEVREGQQAVMEFLLLNHPLDCPICDQAGECGLQDYAFRHGVATSRYEFEDKRTYAGRERIPLGPSVVLNMNRCIQCTRCVRFTQEVAGTGELGFFERGARAEIGVFPGRQLDGDLAGNVVDLCPVGALTSTRFRFAERVWNLTKSPSLCTGCDVGCNVTLEHRQGKIRRYKPRHNEQVNDYWLCDHGRSSHERYTSRPRLLLPQLREEGQRQSLSWNEAIAAVARRLRSRSVGGTQVFLASGHLTNEEAYLLAKLADQVESPHRSVYTEASRPFHIPNPTGGITARRAAPNRIGIELAGVTPGEDAIDSDRVLGDDGASDAAILLVVDSDLGDAADDPAVVTRLRLARFLVVLGWGDSALAQAADLVLPTCTHAERSGSYVNVERRLQRFSAAFPAPGQARPTGQVLTDLLARYEPTWERSFDPAEVFAELASEAPAFSGLAFDAIPATGVALP